MGGTMLYLMKKMGILSRYIISHRLAFTFEVFLKLNI